MLSGGITLATSGKYLIAIEKAKKWVDENSAHNIYWSAWNVE